MTKNQNESKGEQLDLIDVHPENEKEIIAAAKLYKKFQAARKDALSREVKQKQIIITLTKEAKLKPLEDGRIKYRCGNLTISITPRDELVQVRERDEEE